MKDIEIVTDTSTIAVFDLEALKHRIDEDGDWWTSDTFPELREELENENIVLVDTQHDGKFRVILSKDKKDDLYKPLNCPSKKIYIVCGEEIPGEGLAPGLVRGGALIEVKAEKIYVSYHVDNDKVYIGLKA